MNTERETERAPFARKTEVETEVEVDSWDSDRDREKERALREVDATSND